MVEVEVIDTSELGNRSYVAHDGQVAVVIDPQRDLDRVEAVLAAAGLSCGLVVETHVHNDYVTGGYELARRNGVPYVLSAAESVSFDRYPVEDGDRLAVGSLSVEVVATPGHTDSHLSYVISDGDGPPAVFTGGSLLYGTVGRTDLVHPDRTEELTRAQYRSARRLAAELPDEAAVFPTHGFGSFCSSNSTAGGSAATIGDERIRNDALTEPDEDTFTARLIAQLTAYPAYYAHMAPLNRQGPSAADLTPPEPVDAIALKSRIAAGEWVVDLRDRTAYAAGHLAGTVGIELGRQFATYLGWLLPWGSPVTLIGETAEQVAQAQRQLVRIGIDRPAGAAVGPVAGECSYPRVGFADLPTMADGVILDVRRNDERATGAIPGSLHIPLHQLLDRLGELPERKLWIHCGTGFRASVAAALLERAGRDVVLIDDDFGNAATAMNPQA
ncbi:MBL fold metallo-hydrolase [Streptantibioticus ferralitis]|uniref:MBL fold metallo-hydrolase n=1 Tax=Streptantibioticus ferralitis TaxID=236510 RepID=A0ABT5YV40_9ACTN|nr:MBL fold metallo-hydrolase [Streptantibioticus ferralitis]MDF2255343.1 MBL fold metallo-hydrolase [Streptantibioticus ferralitis]